MHQFLHRLNAVDCSNLGSGLKSLFSYANLIGLFRLSIPQFPHPQNKETDICTHMVAVRIK